MESPEARSPVGSVDFTDMLVYVYIYDVVHVLCNIIIFTKFSPPANSITFFFLNIY